MASDHAYFWLIAPLLVAPFIILQVPGFPGTGIEANAPQALIYGWLLQFGFPIIPYFARQQFQPRSEAELGGSWLSLMAVLGGVALWVSIFVANSGLWHGLAYCLWLVAIVPIVLHLGRSLHPLGGGARWETAVSTIVPLLAKRPNGNREIALNFITPHQKWGIHSTYTDNLLMLTLSRGGPCVWLSEIDARSIGVEDNDWIEVFNTNGALSARAVVSQRVKSGMCLMYHAQEKIVNVPGSETTKTRGIHTSVTRVVLTPTHIIGGYAQYSYGFNYYGTIGTNPDEFVLVRKMNKVDWLDPPVAEQLIRPSLDQGETA